MKKPFFILILALAISIAGCKERLPEHPINSIFDAAESGNVSKLREYVSRSADINALNANDNSALMLAVVNHHVEAAKLLINSGANPNIKHRYGADLIMLSLSNVKDPSIDMLNYTISLGLNVNYVTPDGESALDIAIDAKHLAAVKRLVQVGAKPSQKAMRLIKDPGYPQSEIIEIIIKTSNKYLTSVATQAKSTHT